MSKQIDTCGLSCPQPVLLVHDAFKQGEKNLDVLVDNEASLENITRAALKNGCRVNAHEQKNGMTRLEIRP